MMPSKVAIFFLSAAGLASGAYVESNYVDGACVEFGFPSDADLFPSKYYQISSEYSLLWDVTYHGTYKVLTNTLMNTRYVLYQCGTEPPADEEGTFVQVPITSAATTSTTYLPFFEMIGERAGLKVLATDFDYVTSPCLRKMHRDGLIEQAFDPATFTTFFDFDVDITFGSNFSSPQLPNRYVLTDTFEDSVLETIEYIQIAGLFFNREREASEVVSSIAENFECVKERVAEERGDTNEVKRVLYTNYWNGGWSVASCPNWYCEIFEAAGGEVVLGTEEPEVEIWGWPYYSTEQILALANQSDVIVSNGVWPEDVWMPSLPTYDAQGEQGSRDWFERRPFAPDVLLQDFANALWGLDYDRTFLRRLDEPKGARAEDLDAACPDIEAEYVFHQQSCGQEGENQEGDSPSSSSSSKKKSNNADLGLYVGIPILVVVILAIVGCLYAGKNKKSGRDEEDDHLKADHPTVAKQVA